MQPLQETNVRLAAQVAAQQIVLNHLTLKLYHVIERLGLGRQLEADLAQLEEHFEDLTLPDSDAAVSDVLSDDLREAVRFLIAELRSAGSARG